MPKAYIMYALIRPIYNRHTRLRSIIINVCLRPILYAVGLFIIYTLGLYNNIRLRSKNMYSVTASKESRKRPNNYIPILRWEQQITLEGSSLTIPDAALCD